jgi:ppGpp synthetase/RelA/SpoT-type nucleotidyltranferase
MKKPEIHILNEGEVFNKSRYKAIFGDFDKDGIDNLDDPNPTKKGDTTTVEERKLVDGMSKLLDIKNNLDITMHHAVKDLAAIAPKDSKIYARTKTPYSIVQKLIEKRLIVPKDLKKGLTDLIGTTIAVDDYADILKMRSLIENGKIYEVYEIEDFYKHPLDGYMAVHYILIYKDDKGTFPIELQLKTKRMKAINEISHGAYAAHNLDKSRLLECTSLANRADKGDENAIKEFNHLMEDKDKLKDSFYLNKTKKMMANGGGAKLSKADMVFIENMELWVIGSDKVPNEKEMTIRYATSKAQEIDSNFNPEHLLGKSTFYANGGAVNEEWSEINNMYNNGGGLESFTTVEEYFKNLPFDKLPKEFSDYVKKEILTDSDLKHLSQNEPIFVQIKDKIDGYLKPVETTESVAPNKNLALRIKLLKKNLEKDPSNISIKTRIKLLSKNLSK